MDMSAKDDSILPVKGKWINLGKMLAHREKNFLSMYADTQKKLRIREAKINELVKQINKQSAEIIALKAQLSELRSKSYYVPQPPLYRQHTDYPYYY